MFTNGGSWSGDDAQDKGAEIFDPASGQWRLLRGITSLEMLSDDPENRQRQDYYGFFFAWTGASGALHRDPHLPFYTRKGSDRGNPQSTILHCIEKIHTHSNGTAAPSRQSRPAAFDCILSLVPFFSLYSSHGEVLLLLFPPSIVGSWIGTIYCVC